MTQKGLSVKYQLNVIREAASLKKKGSNDDYHYNQLNNNMCVVPFKVFKNI